MPDAVIVAATRSPIGKAFKGSLKDVRPDDLIATIAQAAVTAADVDPQLIDDLYVGCAEPSHRHGANMARVAAVLNGWDHVPAATINRFCASSVQTTRMAMHAIRAGEGEVFISAGVECVSQYAGFSGAGGSAEEDMNPRFDTARARSARISAEEMPWSDPREQGLLPDIYLAMGQTAENVAARHQVSRQRQDEWAVISQNRAEVAAAAGHTAAEITPVIVPDGTTVVRDDCPRAGVTLEGIQGLKPVFREQGTVTAGNCCPLNDGAAALVVMSEDAARREGLSPLARIVATGVSALSPELMGLGPVEATHSALARAGLSIRDIDLYEINEAFAAQVLPSADQLGMDLDRLNIHGGAIALGHPFGATGARITTTLLGALRARDLTFGLETMCVGGGQGMAIIYERLS